MENIELYSSDLQKNNQLKKMSKGEFINLLQSDPLARQQFYERYKKNHIPLLKMEVIFLDGSECELDEEDISTVFSRFGKISQVKIDPSGKALILFDEILNAYLAKRMLNNHEISEENLKLKVEWCELHEFPEYLSSFQNLINNNNTHEIDNKVYINKNSQNHFNPIDNLLHENVVEEHEKNGNKFTCRYEIQIDNEKEFQVARRIIGPNGCNMKRIIEDSIKECSMENNISNDAIKLRVRGKGSGFKEGTEKQESLEPLHLCISSKYYQTYQVACKYIEQHLLNIYEDYKNFCETNHKSYQNLSLKKKDNNSARSSNPSNPNKKSNQHDDKKELIYDFSKLTLNDMSPDHLSVLIKSKNADPPKEKDPPPPYRPYPQFPNPPNFSSNFTFDMNYFPSRPYKPMNPQTNYFMPKNHQTPSSSMMNPSSAMLNSGSGGMINNGSGMLNNAAGKINNSAGLLNSQSGLLNNSQQVLNNPPGMLNNSSNNMLNNQSALLNNGSNLLNNALNPSSSLMNPGGHLAQSHYSIQISEEEIKRLIEERNKARREQNFGEADRIREFLKQKGIALMDEKGGRGKGTEVTTWRVCKPSYMGDGKFYK